MSKQNTLVLISGCTKGLGKALLHQFNEFTCICLNRRKYQSTDLLIDLGESEINLSRIVDLFKNHTTIIYINNASTIEPIADIRTIQHADLDYATNLNFLNPSKIILSILQENKKFIIVNITTGAVFTSNTKLGVYSATKAAMHRLIEILEKEEENNTNALLIKNFDPGRMQTEMQKTLIRKKSLKNHLESLKKPSEIAKELFQIIKKVLNEEQY